MVAKYRIDYLYYSPNVCMCGTSVSFAISRRCCYSVLWKFLLYHWQTEFTLKMFPFEVLGNVLSLERSNMCFCFRTPYRIDTLSSLGAARVFSGLHTNSGILFGHSVT